MGIIVCEQLSHVFTLGEAIVAIGATNCAGEGEYDMPEIFAVFERVLIRQLLG